MNTTNGQKVVGRINGKTEVLLERLADNIHILKSIIASVEKIAPFTPPPEVAKELQEIEQTSKEMPTNATLEQLLERALLLAKIQNILSGAMREQLIELF